VVAGGGYSWQALRWVVVIGPGGSFINLNYTLKFYNFFFLPVCGDLMVFKQSTI
jgi:hypothetical protein